VPNPRPWRREEHPTVVCNGLLRCKNQNCMQPVHRTRRYNRDITPVATFVTSCKDSEWMEPDHPGFVVLDVNSQIFRVSYS
jgi:hypothetical protein